MSVEALEPSSEVAELPNKPLKKQKNNYRGPYLVQKSILFCETPFPTKNKRNIRQNSALAPYQIRKR